MALPGRVREANRAIVEGKEYWVKRGDSKLYYIFLSGLSHPR
jgi:hypothetical protein